MKLRWHEERDVLLGGEVYLCKECGVLIEIAENLDKHIIGVYRNGELHLLGYLMRQDALRRIRWKPRSKDKPTTRFPFHAGCIALFDAVEIKRRGKKMISTR